jgi:predicted enzyme related to lactoylglutathione lyase
VDCDDQARIIKCYDHTHPLTPDESDVVLLAPSAPTSILTDTEVVAYPLIEFPADDPERACRFWSEVLGVKLEPRRDDAGAGWESEEDGLRLGVHERGPGPGDTASLPYFTIADMAVALEHVRAQGGAIIHPGERWSICRDSEGNPFALAAAADRASA